MFLIIYIEALYLGLSSHEQVHLLGQYRVKDSIQKQQSQLQDSQGERYLWMYLIHCAETEEFSCRPNFKYTKLLFLPFSCIFAKL